MVRAAAWIRSLLTDLPLVFSIGRRDLQLALQFQLNMARSKQGFDLDSTESGAADALLRMILKSLADDDVERLSALLFVSTDPLGLALSAYEVLTEEAHRMRFTDPYATEELLGAARILAKLLDGLIYNMGKVKVEKDKTVLMTPLKDMLQLQCVYMPQREISNLELALDISCEPVLISGEVQRISNDQWFKKGEFFGEGRALEKWARDLITSPAMLFGVEFSSYLIFLFLLSSLQSQTQYHAHHTGSCRDRPEWRDSIHTDQGCTAWNLPIDSGRMDRIDHCNTHFEGWGSPQVSCEVAIRS